MVTSFAEQLVSAEGRSEFIIAVVADIRGFSAFSTVNESPNIAMFIKRFYLRLINDYFPSATFVKPTGDGLLMTFRYSESSLVATAEAVLEACARCLVDFPTICKGDPMINFEVPQAIGFGVARGTACCLHSGETTLDYSGHLLNLAARLNDLARPSGIVIHGQFLRDVIPASLRDSFKEEQVFVRSIAEDSAMTILYLSDFVQVPETAKQPLTSESWETQQYVMSVKSMKKSGVSRFLVPLSRVPKGKDKIKVRLAYPHPDPSLTLVNSQNFPHFEYEDGASGPFIRLHLDKALEIVTAANLKQSVEVTFRIEYVPKPQPRVLPIGN